MVDLSVSYNMSCAQCSWHRRRLGVMVADGGLFSTPVNWMFPSYLDEDEEEPEEDDQEIKDKTLPKWQIWLAVERSRDQRHWRPWRPDKTKKQTEEDCEDPERQACTLHYSRVSVSVCLSLCSFVHGS